MTIPTIEDVRRAEGVIRQHLSPAPLIRSYALENELKLGADRRVWIKDYGWTPVGSFKLYGALNWMHQHEAIVGGRPVAGHSSGNFAAGLAFAGQRYKKRTIIVMPDTATKVKFALTQSFDAEIRTYDIATDHLTGVRDTLTRQIAEQEAAVQASPYDDADVIAGNGVGGLEIAAQLRAEKRNLSHFVCAVSGGGLMAGHALAIAHEFTDAKIVGVEPAGADDFRQSLAAGERRRLERPSSFCDGLLSYDVGETNWPILKQYVTDSIVQSDAQTCAALKWLYQRHGLRAEPSGVITLAAVLHRAIDMSGHGDLVIVVSGRNVDEEKFQEYLKQ
jgi:threo-3-hydroxy-L-aspartate ammonia-lyase